MVIFADKILNIYVYKNLEESEIVQWPFLGEGIVFDQLKEPTRVWTADTDTQTNQLLSLLRNLRCLK